MTPSAAPRHPAPRTERAASEGAASEGAARRGRGRRGVVALLVVLAGVLALAGPAAAHPLGNFSVNHLTEVSVSSDRVDVRYVLDEAEIPTFQDRGRSRSELLSAKLGELRSRLELKVDGRRVPLAVQPGAKLTHPRGQGGLPTTRLEVALSAPVDGPRRIEVHDGTYPGRVGWKAVIASPGDGTAVRSSAPSGDPTRRLTAYPEDLLSSPLDRRDATLSVRAGSGTLVAPEAEGANLATTTDRGGSDGFAGIFDRAAAGEGVLLLLFLAAFGWGALHALSPGHGKSMVAAYLVGTRGTAKHAIALGATVTITHTAGVFALGVVTLALSAYVLPEDLYPWLGVASGLLVVLVGAGVLRSRIRAGRHKGHTNSHHHPHPHDHHHHHDHDHDHDHTHDHAHTHSHSHDGGHTHAARATAGHTHSHNGGHTHAAGATAGQSHSHSHDGGHTHAAGAGEGEGHSHSHGLFGRRHHHHHHGPESLTWKGLIGLGASAGLLPCPSALVVLLAALSQHKLGLGLGLIVAFSLGLATTLSVLGLIVVHAGKALTKATSGRPLLARAAAAAPAISALVIVGAGLMLTARALPGVA